MNMCGKYGLWSVSHLHCKENIIAEQTTKSNALTPHKNLTEGADYQRNVRNFTTQVSPAGCLRKSYLCRKTCTRPLTQFSAPPLLNGIEWGPPATLYPLTEARGEMMLQFVLAVSFVLSDKPQQRRMHHFYLPPYLARLRHSDYTVQRKHIATKTTGLNIDTAGHPSMKSSYRKTSLERSTAGNRQIRKSGCRKQLRLSDWRIWKRKHKVVQLKHPVPRDKKVDGSNFKSAPIPKECGALGLTSQKYLLYQNDWIGRFAKLL